VAECFTIYSSHSRRPVRKLFDTPSYVTLHSRIFYDSVSTTCGFYNAFYRRVPAFACRASNSSWKASVSAPVF